MHTATTAKKIEKKMFAVTAKIATARAVHAWEEVAKWEAELAALYDLRWA